MGWMPLSPKGIAMCQTRGVEAQVKKGASMAEVSIIAVDLAKNMFPLHGAVSDGSVVFRKKLSRLQFAGLAASRVWTG